jgi:hypothetical protein
MIRIRGTVGTTPVDLTVEMDAEDWTRLAAQLPVSSAQPSVAPAAATPSAASGQADELLQTALGLVRSAGQISGPRLLAQLEDLTESTPAAKRVLVRLRHSPLVSVHSGEQAPLYCWKDQ